MKFYHGSDNPNIKELSMNYANHGAVYLTKRYEIALFYAACSVRFWNYDKENDKLIIREVCKDSLKKMYQGKQCYIYTTEDIADFEEYKHMGCKNYRTYQNVKLESKETIVDAYEKIMELYNKGELKLCLWEDYNEEQKQKQKERIKSTICSDMVLNYTKYRKDYDILVKLFPEFALTKEEIDNLENNKE